MSTKRRSKSLTQTITMATLLKSTGLANDTSSDSDSETKEEEKHLEFQILNLRQKIKNLKKKLNSNNIKKGINLFKNLLNFDSYIKPPSPKSPRSVPKNTQTKPKVSLYKSVTGHGNKVQGISWKSDSTEIVSIAQDGYMFIWNAITGNKRAAIPLTTAWPMCVDWNNDETLIASAGLDSICSIYNVNNENVGWLSKRPECELLNHQGYISGCKFMNNDKILTCSGDSSIIYWDIEYTKPISVWKDHIADVSAIDVNNDKKTFVSVSCDSQCKIWDISRAKKPVYSYKGLKNDLNDVKYFPDHKSIGVASDNGETILYDIPSRQKICSYMNEKNKSNAMCLDFSKSGKYLFTAYDGEPWCYMWDTIKGEIIEELPHKTRPSAIKMSPNGKTLVTGSWDNKIRFWN